MSGLEITGVTVADLKAMAAPPSAAPSLMHFVELLRPPANLDVEKLAANLSNTIAEAKERAVLTAAEQASRGVDEIVDKALADGSIFKDGIEVQVEVKVRSKSAPPNLIDCHAMELAASIDDRLKKWAKDTSWPLARRIKNCRANAMVAIHDLTHAVRHSEDPPVIRERVIDAAAVAHLLAALLAEADRGVPS